MDLGVYCINAARYLFRSEPEELVAFGATFRDDPRFMEIHEMASAILRFPGERLASFTSSLGSASVDTYTVVGRRAICASTRGMAIKMTENYSAQSTGRSENRHSSEATSLAPK